MRPITAYVSKLLRGFAPPPRLTVSEFADRELVVTSGPLAGSRWNTSFAEYQRGILDIFSESGIEYVALECSSQVGKTSICVAIVCYHVSSDPCDTLIVQPTVKPMGEDFGKNRLNTIIDASPALREAFGALKSKDSSNTILSKTFGSHFLAIGGANSAASLAARAVRLLLLDEIERYPPELPGEGNTLQIAMRRTMTYRGRRRIVLSSTPTLAGGPIDTWFKRGDQRYFNVPCPECGVLFAYEWKQVRWTDGDASTARIHCPHCNYGLDDADRVDMVASGEWVATNPDRREKNIASFHLWEAYSPLASLSEIVSTFMTAREAQKAGDQTLMHTFENTVLGEPIPEDAGEGIDAAEVLSRREVYAEEVPARALYLTLGIDTQDDRIEIKVWGYGLKEESWLVGHFVLDGDTSQQPVWDELAAFLDRKYRHESGRAMLFGAAAIDSAGHRTNEVYAFVRKYGFRKVYAIIGRAGDIPIVSLPTKKRRKPNTPKLALYTVGVDALKALFYGRLRLTAPGPGYVHLPVEDWCGLDFADQLTAERLVTKMSRGRPVKFWKKIRPRNEALDCTIYGLWALRLANPNLVDLADAMERAIGEPGPDRRRPAADRKKQWIPRKRNDWLKGRRA